jgi:Tfp pilus assembly protein PilO
MRTLIAVVVLVVVASIAGWWVALHSPARQQEEALVLQTASLESQESQLTNQRQQLLELQARAPDIRRSLDRLNQFIPADPAQASFLELLQLAGDAAGITFTSLTFTDPAPVEGAPPTADPRLVLGSIRVSGTVESGYFQLVDFLRRLEVEVPRAVLVEQVSMTQGTGGFPTVTTTFQAQMFALVRAPVVPVDPNAIPDPAVPADPDAPTPSPSPTPGATAPSGTAPAPTAPAPEGSIPSGPDGDDADLQLSGTVLGTPGRTSGPEAPGPDLRGRPA